MQPGADSNAKQLIVERIRQSTNILVAVSSDPSVDALSAALALTILLNKMEKHATAVFSGQTPPAIQFLEPTKTFASSVDSLRDFIISLDKEKADRLRYKVEDDVVRIFITPYKTTLSEQDLQFSQGDFNVELILALGVEKREDLDRAITAHGRILHDATVVTMNANNQQSSLGAVDWHDANASSLCEMLISLSEAFQKPGLVDTQIATALLTGMVAATERFSNQHTTPRVMTMAAQMMAAGANQQLVANNLQIAAAPKPLPQVSSPTQPVAKAKNGQLEISHDKTEKPVAKKPTPEEELAAALPALKQGEPSLDELKKQIEQETKSELGPRKFIVEPPKAVAEPVSDGIEIGPAPAPEPQAQPSTWRGRRLEPPALGGSLSATTEQALEDKNITEEEERNKKILSHVEPPAEPKTPALPALPIIEPPAAPGGEPAAPVIPMPPAIEPQVLAPPAPEPTPSMPETPTTQPPAQSIEALEAARKAVDDALASQPFNPAGQPTQAINAQPMLVEPLPEPAPIVVPAPPSTPGVLPPIPPMPQLPVQEPIGPSSMPPMPPALPPLPNDGQMPAPLAPPAPPADPTQYKIPGQP